jgi:hypothetical protein
LVVKSFSKTFFLCFFLPKKKKKYFLIRSFELFFFKNRLIFVLWCPRNQVIWRRGTMTGRASHFLRRPVRFLTALENRGEAWHRSSCCRWLACDKRFYLFLTCFSISTLSFLLKKNPNFLGGSLTRGVLEKRERWGFFIDFHACQHYFWFFLSWK